MKVLEPLNGYVILEPKEDEELLAGNIIIPDLGKEKPAIGKVLAYSNFYNFQTGNLVYPNFSVGDTVLIPKMGSQKITLDGIDYFLCKTVEVIGIIKNQ